MARSRRGHGLGDGLGDGAAGARLVLLAGLLLPLTAGHTGAQAPDAGTTSDAGPDDELAGLEPLAPEAQPKLDFKLEPSEGARVGQVVTLEIRADARVGDHVTIPKQGFGNFELLNQNARVEPEKDGRQRFVFELRLLALEAGPQTLPAIALRVVTADGQLGSSKLDAIGFEVKSLLQNEPNAEPKPATKPVVVMEDDYTLLYIGGGLLGAALIALLTWLFMRWWSRRERPEPPPPPPRPPWELAVERLAALRKRKASMIDAGQGAQFVDEVSDVVRDYLGAHFGFDGLETTTDEMLSLLRARNAPLAMLQEVSGYLGRCDLVKFAKVEPDADEVDLIFAKAQDIVLFNSPKGTPGEGDDAGEPQ
ncbi:MAG: hypothetical protein OEZ06_31660 [Myxococcales bacterium]|nr:hypothetical protein [Myxococcales bacterium]